MTESPIQKLLHKTLRGPTERDAAAEKLYMALVTQSRRKEFYTEYGVPDTVDGRFEMVALHAFLVFNRLKSQGDKAAGVSQAMYDIMFRDMDASVRELGAGDLGVGKRVKFMTEAFNGRIKAYEAVLDATGGELEAALRRNVYGTVEPTSSTLTRMAEYVRNVKKTLEKQPNDALIRGMIRLPSFAPVRYDY